MRDALKTRTKPLAAKNYLNAARTELAVGALTRLVDDAVAMLADIRYNGYGAGNQRRSQGVVRRSFRQVLVKAGYTERQANVVYRDQVEAMDALAVAAEE